MGASLLFMASAWDEPPLPSDDRLTHVEPAPLAASHPDRATVDAVRAGDRTAFEALYLRSYDALWAFAARYLRSADAAEDAVQDVFLALWRTRDAWAPQGSVDAYLFAAVRNRAFKQLRHQHVVDTKQVAVQHEMLYAHEPASVLEAASDDDDDERAERRNRVRAALTALPERHATALFLRWHRDLTYPEIAIILGISPQAARTLVLRVQERLKAILDGTSSA